MTEAARYLLEFSEIPPGPNDRMHWSAKAKLTRQWRTSAGWKARDAEIPPLGQVRISAVIRRRALGVADEDNDRARLKPLVDGLTDAGVIKRDTRRYVAWGTVTEARGEPGVTLVIEAIGGDDGPVRPAPAAVEVARG